MNKQQFDVWKSDVEPALKSKVEEYHLLGYKSADEEQVWNCVMEKLEKIEEPIRLHVLVNYILTLKLSEYMNRITVSSYKESAKLYSTKASLDDLLGEIETHASTNRHLT
ncbi:hypothetical protein D7Z54_32290 [Salibacterium salarium]|uniref:Post-transcriptional regulator n=1 Tax=Salibacterium salarium TaxID=284579 RepID=A0A428MT06_9BACI|nr:post-transcriptional regulator [Salibacterium salarium]RSL29247.1 hypothetical protein D7Z54_32290 [Salibacterium salarium]